MSQQGSAIYSNGGQSNGNGDPELKYKKALLEIKKIHGANMVLK
jgi:hypothetical protein